MLDRLLARLSSRGCLAACAVLALAPIGVGGLSGWLWISFLGLPFAAMFGMGGADRDFGITERQRKEQR